MAQFDGYAHAYDAALDEGLSLSGESKAHFARERVRWLAARLSQLGARCSNVLDFGCGTGDSALEFLEQLRAPLVVGVDVSRESVAVARRTHDDSRLQFKTPDELEPDGQFGVVYCNGVFHHIEPPQRAGVLGYVRQALAPRGYFAFWENNPWNPGTRMVMRRIPFDRDAQLVWPGQARELLARAGFEVLRTDFLFLFPRVLSALRPLEAKVCRVPAGAQYMVLCRKP